MGIENEAAEELVSGTLEGVDRGLKMAGGELLSDMKKALLPQEKPSVRKTLNEIKQAQKSNAQSFKAVKDTAKSMKVKGKIR